MGIPGFSRRCSIIFKGKGNLASATTGVISSLQFRFRSFSSKHESPELKELIDYLDELKNYEKLGVPTGAGTDSGDGFDLGRMRRLMDHLGNPQSKFKAVHIAGTKGKGSTAAFLSSMLRAEGYSVGCYTSPHIRSITERISLGRSSMPVSVNVLSYHFQRIKRVLDKALELENGCISHFEVFTAIAFSLFAEEKVDIAVIEAGLGGARDATNILSSSELLASVITTVGAEHLAALGGSLESIAVAKSGIIKYNCPVVLGGPFPPHIERIFHDKASLMSSSVVHASGTGTRTCVKSFSRLLSGKPYQLCDIVIQTEKDHKLKLNAMRTSKLSESMQMIELWDVKLFMLGTHQLQNAATATCAALCLREKQGWRISDYSIRAGLENTYLLGRSQFLTSKEAAQLGLSGLTILLDGAHTEESARALIDTLRTAFSTARLVFVVAMASDKDHLAFARQLLSGKTLDAVVLTEVDIAGGKSRMTKAVILKQSWIQASRDMGVRFVDEDIDPCGDNGVIITVQRCLEESIRVVNKLIMGRRRLNDGFHIVVFTGSLHIAGSLLDLFEGGVNE